MCMQGGNEASHDAWSPVQDKPKKKKDKKRKKEEEEEEEEEEEKPKKKKDKKEKKKKKQKDEARDGAHADSVADADRDTHPMWSCESISLNYECHCQC